ncbi:P-loop containing nucleoside triphosphate hydrolase protein [Pholiota molesta]|nr:P-loop containing nucleoside triphosphate hydrolase protein [Pholiota molesta]
MLNVCPLRVMGPTGVGKSTFINSLLKSVGGTQPCVEVGHGLQSCTSHLKPIVIPFAHGENGENLNGFTNPNGHNEGRLVLVDTPGFDDTYEDDAEILRRISVWLGISYVAGMKLGGVIYLHDITQTRMLGTTRRNLTMFRKLVGEDALKCVFLGTTKWRLVEPAAGAKRQEQLEAVFWKDLIDAGAQVFSVQDQDTPESSVHDQGIPQVNSTLDQDARAPEDGRIHTEVVSTELLLTIQRELVMKRMTIPQTEAGQTLKYSLDQLIQLEKRKVKNLSDEEFEQGREELDRLLKAAKELKVPLRTRIKRFFGF